MEEARARFESYLQPQPDGCIVWTGGKSKFGYGQFNIFPKIYRSHRVAWILAGRTIPNGYLIRHKCRTRACCNVEHLETGTHIDNVNDKFRDDTIPRGEKLKQSKLTSEEVLEIRARANEPGKDLAEEFGVNKSCISKILNGKSWTHI